jgi:hypothetical protein
LEKYNVGGDGESEESVAQEIKDNEETKADNENSNRVEVNLRRIINNYQKQDPQPQNENEVEMKKIENEKILEEKAERKISNISNSKVEEEAKTRERSGSQSRKESKVKKEKELLNQQFDISKESWLKRMILLLVELIITFFLSLYPNWCDEFENRNPVIDRKKEIEAKLAEKKKAEEENDIVIENIENQKNAQRDQGNSSVDFDGKDRIERVVNKSTTETKKVNNEDDQTKYQLVEETENKTEKEFVFSENVQIDNLSYYNEPVSEYKKKESENKLNANK